MNVVFINRQQQVCDLLPKVMEQKNLGFDTETTGLDPFKDEVIAVQIGNEDVQYVIDAREVNLEPLKPFFDSKANKKILHNASFDWSMLYKTKGIDLEGMRCTYIAEKLLFNGKKESGFSLDAVLESRLGVKLDKSIRMSFENHRGAFTQAQIDYMAADIKYLVPLAKEMSRDLQRDGLGPTWVLECEAIAPFDSMGLNGFKLDADKWRESIEYNRGKAEEAREMMDDMIRSFWVTDMFGNVMINYDSPQQILELMRDKMKIKVPQRNPQTGKEELMIVQNTNGQGLKLAHKVPFVKLLSEYRTYQKMISTYGQKFIDNIHPITGKLHFKLNQLGTATGRPTSRKGSAYNPLNIPRDKKYRHAFIADDDYVIETDDYSGCELRIWAELSQDPGLCEAFRNHIDVHSYVGQKLFSVEVSKHVNSHIRQITKPLNFGIAYDMSPMTLYFRCLAEGVDTITFEEIKRLYNIYTKQEFKVGVDYLREVGRKAIQEDGYATTINGRRRYWLHPNPENRTMFPKGEKDQKYRGVISKMQREAGNMPIQGCNADMTKRALRLIWDAKKERGFRTEFKNMPYDEIVTMTHKDDSPEFVEIKRKLMIQAGEEFVKTIPIEVEGAVMGSWTK